ncbi:DUF4345 domain-containing protein [Leptospira sp. 96542]|nr:DUF4345 domain-containing protein [Leptospira sp. 96542]
MKNILILLNISITGILLVFLGFLIILNPRVLFETNQVELGTDPNLLSEIKAPGGALLAFGLLLCFSLVRSKIRTMALGSTAVFLLGYGFARIVSIAFDGMPAPSLVTAMVMEIGLGLVCLWAGVQTKENF